MFDVWRERPCEWDVDMFLTGLIVPSEQGMDPTKILSTPGSAGDSLLCTCVWAISIFARFALRPIPRRFTSSAAQRVVYVKEGFTHKTE